MKTKDWAHEVNPAEVDISILKEIILCDERSLRLSTCMNISDTKEEIEILRDLLEKAIKIQRKD